MHQFKTFLYTNPNEYIAPKILLIASILYNPQIMKSPLMQTIWAKLSCDKAQQHSHRILRNQLERQAFIYKLYTRYNMQTKKETQLTIFSISIPDLKYFLDAILLSTCTCPANCTSFRTLSAGSRSSAIFGVFPFQITVLLGPFLYYVI